MVYNYRTDYEHIFDTPAKKEQENVIASKIMSLLNNNKYDNIYDFISKNHTYQDFLKNNELENVVKHFGNTLSEEDFINIQRNLVKIFEKKRSFEKKDIKKQNVDGKEYSVYEGNEKDIFLDNTNSNMSIERQLEELQKTQSNFQTTDANKNTKNMMLEMESEKKESLNLKFLNEIDVDKLSENEKELFNVATNYQLTNNYPLRIDIERGIVVGEDNNIIKIQNVDGEFSISGNDLQSENKQEIEQQTYQKKLTPNHNTIYSNNN